MKKILFTLFIFFFVNTATSQYYKPKSFVRKLGYSSMPLKLKWAIKLDSNYSIPYYKLAKYYKEKRNYLTNKGSIYYYYKFFEVNKRFPVSIGMNTDYEVNERIPGELITSITLAFQQNPEFFKGESKLSDFSKSELKKIIDEVAVKAYSYDLYMLKAQLDFDNNDLDAYLTTCKVILDKNKDFKSYSEHQKITLQVYDDMVNKFLKIGDTLSASQALNENLKIYKEEEKNNLEYRNKQKQLIALLSYLNNISDDKYYICSSNGIEVFCRNKNVRIANYSSALKFWNVYFQENSIFFDMLIKNNEYFKNTYFNNWQRYFGFKYEYISQLYDFYLKKGKELGMIWPLFNPQLLSSKYFGDSYGILNDVIKSELSRNRNIYDLVILSNFNPNVSLFSAIDEDPQEITIFAQQEVNNSQKIGNCKYLTIGGNEYRSSDSVFVFDISISYPNPSKNLLDIPVSYFDQNKTQYYVNKEGKTLPTKISFKKLYEIEKQNYENEQAQLRAKQFQQEAEVRRLQEEQKYRETQLRLIEEENERKQKEIDLQNAQNKQLEYKRYAEYQKILRKNNNINNSSGTMNNTKSPKRSCNACSNSFDGVGYHYHYDSSGCKAYKGGTFSNGDGKYCSLKCAENACYNEH
jgi:hypothetical protein